MNTPLDAFPAASTPQLSTGVGHSVSHRKRFSFIGIAALTQTAIVAGAALCFTLLTGCALQGEGERCDPLNGSTDCESGLTCTPLDELGQGVVGAVCCPDSNPSDLICTRASFSLGGTDTSSNSASSTTASVGVGDASANSASESDAATRSLLDSGVSLDATSDAQAADAQSPDAASPDAAR